MREDKPWRARMYYKIKKVIYCTIIAIVVSSFYKVEAQRGPPQPPPRIGAILSLTGPAAFLGEQQTKAIELALEEINASGGINGSPLEVLSFDDQGKPAEATAISKRLFAKEVWGVIGPSLSGTSFALVDLFENKRIPLISLASNEKITTKNLKWSFEIPPPPILLVKKIYRHLRKSGRKDIGIMTSSSTSGMYFKKQLDKLAPEFGIKVIAEVIYNPWKKDITPEMLKLQQEKANAIINLAPEPSQFFVAQAWKSLRLGIPLYQHPTVWDFFQNMYPVNGVVFPSLKLAIADRLPNADPQKEVILSYKKAYQRKFGKEPTIFGGFARDAVYMFAESFKYIIRNRGDWDMVRDFLENSIKDWTGVTGIYNMSPTYHNGFSEKSLEFVVVEKGSLKILK